MKLCLACQQPYTGEVWACPACGAVPARHGEFLAFAPELAGRNDSFDPDLFSRHAQVEATNFWFVARNALLRQVLQRYFSAPQNILEIGCGTGFVLANLRAVFPGARLSGSDIYTEGLGFALQRVPTASLFQMDAQHIPFREEFDLIGAFDVLEHIDDDCAVLAQIYRSCRPGGGVLLTVPQHPSLWSSMDEYGRHKRRYIRSELLEKVRGAGFEVCYVTSFVSLLLPAMWLSRAMQRNAPLAADSMDDGLKVRPLLNRLFGAVMAVERMLLAAGLTFPAGGSLLVAARRAA